MKEYQFIGKSVFLEKEKILVVSDLHLGWENSFREGGIFLDCRLYEKIIEGLREIFSFLKKEKKKIKEIVILGDLKHEFSSILNQEWKEVLKLLEFLKKEVGKIVLIRGNHDNYLVSIVKKIKDVKFVDFYVKNENLFVHGDKKISKIRSSKIKRVFLGHLHPSIVLEKESKKEKYKCFLAGKFKGKEVIILPSFFPLVEGVDVKNLGGNLAYNFNLKNFGVFVPIKEEVLGFGRFKDLS